jgi:hypothetical protein
MNDTSQFIERNIELLQKHYNLFGGNFFYFVPSGALTYADKNGVAYTIPDIINTKDLKVIIKDDIKLGENTIPVNFKNFIKKHDPNIIE